MAASNGKSTTPYDQRFDDFIRLRAETQEEIVTIHHPQVLGDEIVESLNRLADAEKALRILPRRERKP